MDDVLRATWDEICLRTLGKKLDLCPPVMVGADRVVEGIFPILQDMGSRASTGLILSDPTSLRVAEAYWKSSCATCTVGALVALREDVQDTARELGKYVLIEAQLMAASDQDYGPVPQGLSGRALGFAALALEILLQRSPQRLLLQQRGQAH